MEFVKITSAQNEAIKHVIKLRDRRPREKEQLTVLEGYRELTRAREYGMELVECFFSPSHFLGENEYPLLETLASEGVRVVEVAPHLLEIGRAPNRLPFCPGGIQRRQEHRRQNCDDRNRYQKFNQSKIPPVQTPRHPHFLLSSLLN